MGDTSFAVSIFAVIIAFTSLVWNIIKQIMNDRHVLKIDAFDGFVLTAEVTLKVIYINVVNASSFPKYSYEPMFCVSKRLFSKQILCTINYNFRENSLSPVELAPGKKTSYYVEVLGDLLNIIKEHYNHGYVQIKVKDTLGRTYRSKKVKLNKFVRI